MNPVKFDKDTMLVFDAQNTCTISIGDYEITLNEDTIAMLHSLSTCKTEYEQLRALQDFVIGSADYSPTDTEKMQMLYHLQNIRGYIDYIASLKVTKKGDVAL